MVELGSVKKQNDPKTFASRSQSLPGLDDLRTFLISTPEVNKLFKKAQDFLSA